jgi:hypothetical protein
LLPLLVDLFLTLSRGDIVRILFKNFVVELLRGIVAPRFEEAFGVAEQLVLSVGRFAG